MVPTIKESIKQAQEAFSEIDMKELNKKIQQSITLVKKQFDSLNKSNKSNEIKLKVNNKEAQKQISQVEKQIDSLQKKTAQRKYYK